jgi:hypothetical protein
MAHGKLYTSRDETMPPKHVEEAKRIADEHDAEVAGTPPAQAAAEPPAPAPEPPAQQAPDLTPPAPEHDDGDWQQKYQTLKGKFDSEVPRLSGELRETRGQLNEVLNRLERVEQPPQQAQPQPQPEVPLVTDEDIESFGPELVDLIRRQATVVANSMTAGLREENAQLRQQVEQVGASTGQVQVDRYLSRLKELVPDYETINVDQGFLNWLGEVDQMAGVPRQAFLNTAFEARDPDRTATLFNSYKEQAGITPRPPAPTPPAPQPGVGANGGNGQIPAGLETQISPNSGSGGGGQQGGSGNNADQIWTSADIRNFTNDILRGTYKGREGEQEAIQAAIDAAIAEGRVRA